MRGKGRRRACLIAAAAILASGCNTLEGKPDHVFGVWGGPHAGINFIGGVADVQFDCASGTIDDPVYPAPDGAFSVKGTYRTGTPGPVKVGQFFKSQDAKFVGQIAKSPEKNAPRLMTLHVALEDGTELGPYTLTEGMPPQLNHCA
ncbi:MAG: hypothetical protein ACJ8F4_05995 [Sphingomonas sp.]